jgi:hypothetical protein
MPIGGYFAAATMRRACSAELTCGTWIADAPMSSTRRMSGSSVRTTGMTPLARAARSMCSVDSMPAGPCSLSTMTKSTPACPHISTSEGAGMPTNMPSSGRLPRRSSGSRVSMTFMVRIPGVSEV